MASCILTKDDLLQLSPAARGEILQLLNSGESSILDPESVSNWTAVPTVIMSKFMAGVSETSKEVLKLLAKSNGELKWSQMRKLMPRFKEWQDLKGFQAGMNRRLRGLIGDPNATFVGWDESHTEYDENDRPVDGILKVHLETAKSLRTYFRMV